ncbi:MAG: ComEC/Rec2 family competence protein [Treponema sp.]|jgi:competence protein ComEC|nr:ComEC/Rec2 family competence protein [Treponema sp.]
MAEPFHAPPLLYGALGAAVSYYGVSFLSRKDGLPWLLGILLVMGILGSLMQVLAQHPTLFGKALRTYRHVRRYRVYSITLILGFSLGLGVGNQVKPLWFGIPEDQIRGIYGTLKEDPRAFHDSRGMGYLALQNVSGKGGLRASAAGTLRVFFPEGTIPRLQEFGRGSEVYLEGTIRTSEPKTKTAGTLGKYFQAQSVHLLRPAPALEQLRTRGHSALMKRFSSEPWGGLAGALLLGVKDQLDTELSQAYQYAGCSHVLALSGMHLAILTAVLALFLRRPLGLKAAALLGGCCILGYVYLVGNLPSLERAAIMYLLGTLAVLGSLPKQGSALLSLAFLLQILLRPESGQSISFILSYLALAGILSVGNPIHVLIQGRIPEVLAKPLAASLGAFIATAASTVCFFGVLRPIGILAGLIIVPLTTLFMLGALAALILPGNYLGLILSFLYDVLMRLVSLAAQVPGIPVLDTLVVAALSLGVSGALMVLSHRQTLMRSNLVPFA